MAYQKDFKQVITRLCLSLLAMRDCDTTHVHHHTVHNYFFCSVHFFLVAELLRF